MNPARLTILLAFLPLACGPVPVDGPPPPGTVRFFPPVPVAAPEAPSLIANGDFVEWYAGVSAPTGFRAPAPDLGSTIDRGARGLVPGGGGYAALQTWARSDGDTAPDSTFGVEIALEPDTSYTLEILATPEGGAAAAVSAWERDETGGFIPLARRVVTVDGEEPVRVEGTFHTLKGGAVVLASQWAGDATPKGLIAWGAWRLRRAADRAPVVADGMDRPERRALAKSALENVRGQIALYGGVAAWEKALSPNRQTVARVLREAGDGAGSVLGYDGFVFGREELREIESPATSPGDLTEGTRAILRAERLLAARGVSMLVVPVPRRAALLLDRLNRQAAERPAHLADHAALLNALLGRDVLAIDPAPHLRHGLATGTPWFALADPELTSSGAAALAQFTAPAIRNLADLPAGAPERFSVTTESIPAARSLAAALPESLQRDLKPADQIVEVVHDARGELFTPDLESPVLAVGSLAILHQLRGGSFAAHLSRALGFAVAVQARALPDREIPAWLAGDIPASTKVVVFCLPASTLAESGWMPVP